MRDEWMTRGVRSDAWAATRPAILENDSSNAAFPAYTARADGAYLWDTDGRRYIDCVMGYGPVVLGHSDASVEEAVRAAAARGICISPLWTPEQVELTELLVEVVPGAEQAFLMKTGSDATSAAVRLARIHTGRDKVAKWGYNGWHDWTAPRQAGVPNAVRDLTLAFEYNAIGSLEALFAAHPEQIACVIMMPFELEPPQDGFLAAVRDLAHENGALFIIDDMRSGFRIALGGSQEFFGVTADLATFSKAMANGHPVSAVVGRQDILEGLAHTHMSSTFFANPAEMAAALATIKTLRNSDVIPRLWQLGESLTSGLSEVVRSHKLPAKVVGYPIAPFLEFEGEPGEASLVEEMKRRFYEEALRGGVLLHPNHQWFLSGAHTEDDISMVIQVCDSAADSAVL